MKNIGEDSDNILSNEHQELLDELEYCYATKKRMFLANFKYMETPDSRKQLRKALKLCIDYGVTPYLLTELAFEGCGRVEFFSPKHMCSTSLVDKIKTNYGGNSRSLTAMEDSPDELHYNEHKITTSNMTLPYEGRWEFQLQKLEGLMEQGRTLEEVLMDTSNKLHAWFRILCTDHTIPCVVEKYREIAKKEMNPKLKKFIIEAGLPADRFI